MSVGQQGHFMTFFCSRSMRPPLLLSRSCVTPANVASKHALAEVNLRHLSISVLVDLSRSSDSDFTADWSSPPSRFAIKVRRIGRLSLSLSPPQPARTRSPPSSPPVVSAAAITDGSYCSRRLNHRRPRF
ncbi:unnamed protein product [Microthlaspi erraticum]|uniref:Uncharacterized protein n=1 Tax=Microthlaspi erraticum TaxID=1685480 RepID=A0A6D2KWB3_9BRAS|nr:unnamed protein product [Microthlaspi erraticum]